MNKGMVYLFISLGGGVGSYIPVLFGASMFSAWTILGSVVGGIAGIYVAYKMLSN